MTRPTQFGPPRPQGVSGVGGDPDLPDGQPTTDCCADPEEMPDRALDETVFIGTQTTSGYAAIIADGPDFYFRFQEPTGAFLDSSGNGVTMTEQSGTVVRGVTGPVPFGLAITDGHPEYLETSFDPSNSTTAVTEETWIKTTSTDRHRIFDSRRTFGVGFQMYVGPTTFGSAAGQVTAAINATSLWQGKHSTATINDGNWHHVAVTWAAAAAVTFAPSQIKIYIDGALAATVDDSNSGSAASPLGADIVALGDENTGGSVSLAEMAWFSSELDATRILEHTGMTGATTWIGASPDITDGDDATYEEVTGPDVLRIDLEAAFEIARVRLLIGCETSGARTYTLYGANIEDFSDAVLVTTLNFTATGSFTADEVTDTWTPTDAYRFWELDGDDETRYIYSFELYEASSSFDTTAIEAAIAALETEIDDHIADTTDAHDASAVSIVDTGGYFTGTDVEAALQELGVGGGSTFADLGWFNVEDYGAVHDGTTDDTVSIQAAIDACAAVGGGTIFFPMNIDHSPTIYQLDGALQDTGSYNSQLEIPQRNVVRADGAAVIRFLGATPGYSNNENGTGVTLRSSWNGTISGNPAIISAGTHDSLSINWTILHFENIEIRAHYDPKLTAIDGTKCGGVRFYNLTVSTYHTNDFDLPLPADWVVPTHSNAIGVDFPRGYDDLNSGGDNLSVQGFYTGIRPGEQFVALNVGIGFCKRGIEFRGEVNTGGRFHHAIYIGRTEFFFCPTGLVFSGAERWVWIGMAGFEHEGSVAASWAPVYDIDDASNYGRGHIGWHTTEWTTGPDDNLLLNGASGLSLHGALAKRWRLANVVDIPVGTNPSTNPTNGRRLYTDSSTGHLSSRDSSGTVFDYETGGVSYATPAIVLGTAAAAGAASTVIRSDSTIVAFDATVPVTQAFGDTAATGSAAVAARRDHKHGMPSGTSGEILISDTPSTPLIFADLIQTEAQDDLVYAD